MTFMYLHLRLEEGRTHASVRSDGSVSTPSLGQANSRRTDGPFGVFFIETFDGLENISDRDLLEELFRRFTTKELLQRLQIRLTNDDVLELVKRRLKGLPAT